MYYIYMHNTTTNKRGDHWGEAFNNYNTAKAYLLAMYSTPQHNHTVSIWKCDGNKRQVVFMDII